jgi:hypothetical protein
VAINSFWQNPFGANAATSGVNPGPGLMGTPPATGSGLFGRFQAYNADPTNREALSAFAAQMLAGSGYSPVKQTGAEIFGRALLASKEARAASLEAIQKQRYQDAQIEALEREKASRSPFGSIDPDQFTPESLAEFQSTGNYGVLKPRGGLSGIGNFNPGDYTPQSFAKFVKSQDPNDLQRYVSPAQPSVQIVNGVPTAVLPSRTGGPTTQDPLSNLSTEANAAATLAASKAQAGAVGTATGEATGGVIKKGMAAQNVEGILDIADPLIDAATGSLSGAAADKLASVFGAAPSGAKAIAQLQVTQAALMMAQPRMEGPQGEKDVILYQQAAGQLGDPAVPRAIKKAAVKTIRQLQVKYKDAAANVPTIYPNGSPEATAADSNHVQSLLDKYAPRK